MRNVYEEFVLIIRQHTAAVSHSSMRQHTNDARHAGAATARMHSGTRDCHWHGRQDLAGTPRLHPIRAGPSNYFQPLSLAFETTKDHHLAVTTLR